MGRRVHRQPGEHRPGQYRRTGAPGRRNEPGGVLIRLGPGGRRVRVPLAPGTFTTLAVESVELLTTSIDLPGGGVLAFDGERTTPVSADATITVSIEASGPQLLDVDTTLALAAADRRFDVGDVFEDGTPRRKDIHGD